MYRFRSLCCVYHLLFIYLTIVLFYIPRVIPAEILPVSKSLSVVITTIESLGKCEVIKWVLPMRMAELTTATFQIPHNDAADGSLSQVENARLV